MLLTARQTMLFVPCLPLAALSPALAAWSEFAHKIVANVNSWTNCQVSCLF